MVPRAGLEPACPYGRWILSPLRLPFRHLGIGENEAALAAEDEIVPEPLVTGQAGDWKGILYRSALANWTGSLGSVLSLLPIGWRNTVN